MKPGTVARLISGEYRGCFVVVDEVDHNGDVHGRLRSQVGDFHLVVPRSACRVWQQRQE